MSTSRGWSIARWVLLGGACALMFLVPSAMLIDLGVPRWAAAPLGALAFPLGPIGWHLWAERARKGRIAGAAATAKKGAPAPKAGGLTVGDRFVLRLLAVALVTCAPWFVLARGRTWHALRAHATWPVDWIGSIGSSGGGFVDADPRLLQYVPGDAEAIVWVRGAADLTKMIGGDTPAVEGKKDDDGLEQAVLAYKKGEVFIVIQADKLDEKEKGSLDTIDQAQAKKYLGHELHFVVHRIATDTVVAVSEGWDAAYVARVTGRTPAAKAVIALFAAAPGDALIVATAIPRETIADLTLRDAIAWLRVDLDAKQLVVGATVHGKDAAGAAGFAAAVQHELATARARLPESCHDAGGKLLDGVHVTTKGDAVSIDTRVAPEAIMAAVFCGLQMK